MAQIGEQVLVRAVIMEATIEAFYGEHRSANGSSVPRTFCMSLPGVPSGPSVIAAPGTRRSRRDPMHAVHWVSSMISLPMASASERSR
ncbi:hypothetical protein, partial [Rhodovulum sulfidophilum]|uniref:hypothetical protein n=1 Tax=Rhodovulum sulfidophilum TaxID=35806 RepID=UPI002279AFC5